MNHCVKKSSDFKNTKTFFYFFLNISIQFSRLDVERIFSMQPSESTIWKAK